MTSQLCVAAFLVFLLLSPTIVISARQFGRQTPSHDDDDDDHRHTPRRPNEIVKPELYMERRAALKPRGPDTLQVAGSSLPDCSHACGSCSPCRLVMVSFMCASLAEAETCPMAYKCMCNSKSYPVP
uniref:Epidermal patterning factor-like protein n=1 Tax=Nelumbo nucifera TaxID=4432 RepID=A0A822XW19_NELNU|nr:TPA_asm: hypothetical protein HUJ06_024438 [Nelumbo nucifera]